VWQRGLNLSRGEKGRRMIKLFHCPKCGRYFREAKGRTIWPVTITIYSSYDDPNLFRYGALVYGGWRMISLDDIVEMPECPDCEVPLEIVELEQCPHRWHIDLNTRCCELCEAVQQVRVVFDD
jgi:hypothetical protein